MPSLIVERAERFLGSEERGRPDQNHAPGDQATNPASGDCLKSPHKSSM